MIVSPGKWVSEEQLIALKGIKKGTLKKAREKSFMEGREYKHVAHDGMPWDNSPCFYNLEEIDRWIERQALMNPLMILVKIIKLRWIHILSYDQMVSRKINNQTTRCANSIFYTTLFTNSAPNYT